MKYIIWIPILLIAFLIVFMTNLYIGNWYNESDLEKTLLWEKC